MTSIAVIGAGIIGLASCRALKAKGLDVTLVDRQASGEGTSYGNAGLIAGYANSPLASWQTLKQLPGQVFSNTPSISIDPRYTLSMAGFSVRFMRAATASRFQRHYRDLNVLLEHAVEAQHGLLDSLDEPSLWSDSGCLQVIRNDTRLAARLSEMAGSKQAEGIRCEALGAAEVQALEPELNDAGLLGGLYFPASRFLRDPRAVCQRLWTQLAEQGVQRINDHVECLRPRQGGGWLLEHGNGTHGKETTHFDAVVLCAGLANNHLLKSLGIALPVVSERGYHLALSTPLALVRPVGWLAHHFYATPMANGVRLAGTTEFCAPKQAPDTRRWHHLKNWGQELFGRSLSPSSQWLGVRHSSPDGLPVVGQVPGMPGLCLAYGHGHLGVTLSALTGELVAASVAGEALPEFAAALAPSRFLRGVGKKDIIKR
ncbi:NAD(P)/FAD-dependent oxidoreductase [Halomonas binhaiensis]|uniref:FAD-binding oxidoreductase n=1 Tax=Halomonas binhaiensis TaxID=2562282 RepID=A0A5C1NDB9_9GAMM|nr:FAD-dependent oxidoreductase [Halomonas binhaiensis]QEM80653.1 FAD-binding oxidoreductase [Halomonas binhaiensis]